MDSLDDSETHAKISDSAYSHSCSNSQGRRSHTSTSTHSGSHSSGSSGYGGKPSTSGSNNSNSLGQPPEKRSKDKIEKKKKPSQLETIIAEETLRPTVIESTKISEDQEQVKENDAEQQPPPPAESPKVENMEIAIAKTTVDQDKIIDNFALVRSLADSLPSTSSANGISGFSCVLSIHDGVVMYTSPAIITTLGFPKDMWIGRSFIDFLHPKDRNAFASQIMSGLGVNKDTNPTQPVNKPVQIIFTRIRTYCGLTSCFGVKNNNVSFMPFKVQLAFKDITNAEGQSFYLVIQATPISSAFAHPNEYLSKPTPFHTRHLAVGKIKYMDPDSVMYLGYLPQDLIGKDILQLYHPEDLPYLYQLYETLVRDKCTLRSRPYRLLIQNGEYVRLETEFSSFINPWSRKLEFVTGKHTIVEGPSNPDVFASPHGIKYPKYNEDQRAKFQNFRDNIVRVLNKVTTKSGKTTNPPTLKRSMELNVYQAPSNADPAPVLRLEVQQPADSSFFERDSEMLGGISPHHENECMSGSETPLSYTQINYNETLQRYFDSYQPYTYEEYKAVSGQNLLRNQGPAFASQPTGSGSESAGSMADSGGMMEEYQGARLSESLLVQHNSQMEKKLIKKHREHRPGSKIIRERTSKENKQKKKEHLARCNAPYQRTKPTPTSPNHDHEHQHGTKRASWQCDMEFSELKSQGRPRAPSEQTSQSRAQAHNAAAAAQWSSPHMTRVPRQLPMNSVQAMPQIPQHPYGMLPMYYLSTAAPQVQMPGAYFTNVPPCTSNQFHTPLPYMMYPQAVIGTSFVYSPMSPHSPHATHSGAAQCRPNTMRQRASPYSSQYEEESGDQTSLSMSISGGRNSGGDERGSSKTRNTNSQNTSGDLTSMSISISGRGNSSGDEPGSGREQNFPKNRVILRSRAGSNGGRSHRQEKGERTDGESSYSSFCSSFFKTESWASGEEADAAGAQKKTVWSGEKTSSQERQQALENGAGFRNYREKRIPRRKEPPWMDQDGVSSDVMYKYQVGTKNMEEVLAADKEKIKALEQPSLVNEQLSQLYLDLQLNGNPSRLTLEEGMTSSGSSGEETSNKLLNPLKVPWSKTMPRRRREYSRLVMIYEEDAPLPPPEDGQPPTSRAPTPSTYHQQPSTSSYHPQPSTSSYHPQPSTSKQK